MNLIERRASISIAFIIALRMFGLFMILPVFSLYAARLQGATPILIGAAMGIYGLTQCIFQIPFGMLSDHYGRRKLIAIGLLIFIFGCMIAAHSSTITSMIIGRALQGTGAVGSTLIALLADLTRTNQRTKAMAIVGMTIGLSFSLAMIAGPIFYNWMNLFWLAALFGLVAFFILFTQVPVPAHETWHEDAEPELSQFFSLIKQPELSRLNLGIFILHTVFTASFIVLPLSLQNLMGISGDNQWKLYLPTLLLAFLLSIPCIIFAEKKHLLKPFFIGAIIVLGIAELSLWFFDDSLLIFASSILLLLAAFSLLEAFLPSLVSRTAPPQRKGTALGIYSSSQFLGIFIGGMLGGYLYGTFGLKQVYLFCAAFTFLWLLVAFGMKKPHYSR